MDLLFLFQFGWYYLSFIGEVNWKIIDWQTDHLSTLEAKANAVAPSRQKVKACHLFKSSEKKNSVKHLFVRWLGLSGFTTKKYVCFLLSLCKLLFLFKSQLTLKYQNSIKLHLTVKVYFVCTHSAFIYSIPIRLKWISREKSFGNTCWLLETFS